MDLSRIVKNLIPDEKDYLFGFADLNGLLGEKYQGYRYVIVAGKKLDDKIIDSIESGPNLDYYNLYKITNKQLDELINSVSVKMYSLGIENKVVPPTIQTKEVDVLRSGALRFGFSHKMAATRAGLGWIGKSDLLISRKFGPRLRLATVLIENLQHFPWSGNPGNESRCGSCSVCVGRCPADACNGILWNKDIEREEFFDPFKCMDKCFELSKNRMGIDACVCGICISVCPHGKK